MKKSVLIVLSMMLVATLMVSCGPAATVVPTDAPTVPPVVCPTAAPTLAPVVCATAVPPTPVSLLTVIGKIKVASPYSLTEDIINSQVKEIQYHDPWVGSAGSDVMEKGILLKDLITLVQPKKSATTIALIGSDGNEYDISIADAQAYDIMLVHWVSGTILDATTGGPVKVAYPADATNYTSDSWAWWVSVIIFK